MMRIAIIAYACSPIRGSEPGMAWNIISRLNVSSTSFDIYVEQEKFQEEILDYLQNHPLQNINFFFLRKRRMRLLRKLYPPSYYWFYRNWHKDVYKTISKESYDVVHNLNMVGYREMGYNYRLPEETKWVWGPIGGIDNVSIRLLFSIHYSGWFYYLSRNIFNSVQFRCNYRLKEIAGRENKVVISATSENRNSLKERYGIPSEVIPEVGCFESITIAKKTLSGKLIWIGTLNAGKNLGMAIQAFAKSENSTELTVVGSGRLKNYFEKQVDQLNLRNKKVNFLGQIPKSEVDAHIQSADVAIITSVKDLTSTVLMEYLSSHLPIVAIDACGFGSLLRKHDYPLIKIVNKKQMSCRMAELVDHLLSDESFYDEIRDKSKQISYKYTWEKLSNKIGQIYES